MNGPIFIEDEDIVKSGNTILYTTSIKNISADEINNVIVNIPVPDGLTYTHGDHAYIRKGDTETYQDKYNDTTKTITVNLGSLATNEVVFVGFYVLVDELDEDIYNKEIYSVAKVQGDGTEEHNSNQLKLTVGKVKAESTANIQDPTYKYKPEEIVTYGLQIKNTGNLELDKLNLKLDIPNELDALSMTYTITSNGELIEELTETGFGSTINIKNIELTSNGVFTLTLKLEVKDVEIKEEYRQVKIKATMQGYEFNGVDDEGDAEYGLIYDKELTTNIYLAGEGTGENPDPGTEPTPTPDPGTEPTPTPDPGTDDKKYKITGIAWFDENEDGKMDITEKRVSNTVVKLVNVENGKVVQETNLDDGGAYEFKNIESGKYQVRFEYDETQYELTVYKKAEIEEQYNSDAIKLEANVATSDVIEITDENITGINMGLVTRKIFDLSLNKVINKVILQTKNGASTYEYNNSKLAKIEIAAKELSGATVLIEYSITIKNEGNLRGVVSKIVDYIPNNMTFSSELNKGWYEGADGNLYTEEFASQYINPGESKTVTLVLRKQMTESNTGIVNNVAELSEVANEKDLKDMNSTPGDKVQGENDMSSADCIISVKTGEEIIYITLILTCVIILGAGMYFIKKKVL